MRPSPSLVQEYGVPSLKRADNGGTCGTSADLADLKEEGPRSLGSHFQCDAIPSSDVDIPKKEQDHKRDDEDARDAISSRAIRAAAVVMAAASE
jgi:hypothetical protein